MGTCNNSNTKNPITTANNPKANNQATAPIKDSNQIQFNQNNKNNDIKQSNIVPTNKETQIDKNKNNDVKNSNIQFNQEGKDKFIKTNESFLQTLPQLLDQNMFSAFNHEGECITLCFGDSFDVFNSFFTTIANEHSLDDTPQYNYNKYFIEESSQSQMKVRGIAIDLPESQFKILNESHIQTRYQQENIKVKPYNTNESFASAYYDTQQISELTEMLRKEAEKCASVSQLHFIGNVFSGYSMGLCSTLLYEISNNYLSSFKIVHLKYEDTYTHKAFSKIKNYIYTISTIYENVQMINMFNTPLFGDVLSALTIGDRISQYSDLNLNRIAGTLLIDPKANFIYSNGIEIKQEKLAELANFVYEDCKEANDHLRLTPQYSSLTIYKGMQLNEELKTFFKVRLDQLKNRKLKMRNCYFGLFEVKQDFGKEFVANFHLSNYFKDYSDQFVLPFIQNYNIGNFTKDELELRQNAIEKVNDLIGYYKEIWKLVK